MSSLDFQIICRKCRKGSPMRDMCYDQNGKDLICTSCANSKEKRIEPMPKKNKDEYLPIKTKIEKKIEPKQEVGKQKYYCVSCSYIFLRNQDVVIDTCPYCDKSTVKKFTAKSSNDLLKDSEYLFD